MFESNTASGTGGGMFIGGDVSDVKIINSTIINNTATSGSNILFALNHNAIRPFLINCIIWDHLILYIIINKLHNQPTL